MEDKKKIVRFGGPEQGTSKPSSYAKPRSAKVTANECDRLLQRMGSGAYTLEQDDPSLAAAERMVDTITVENAVSGLGFDSGSGESSFETLLSMGQRGVDMVQDVFRRGGSLAGSRASSFGNRATSLGLSFRSSRSLSRSRHSRVSKVIVEDPDGNVDIAFTKKRQMDVQAQADASDRLEQGIGSLENLIQLLDPDAKPPFDKYTV